MGTLLLTLSLVTVAWVAAYQRWTLPIWTGALLTVLALFTLQGWGSGWVQFLFWIVVGGGAVFLNMPTVRRQWVSDPFLRTFQQLAPTLSQTEQEALDAGSVWWDGEIFSGRPDWDHLINMPEAKLSTEERAFLDGPVDELCSMIDDWRITHHDYDLPPQVWQYIKQNGFFSMIIPKSYGGMEFSHLAHSEVVMKLSSRSISVAVTVMVPNSLGPGKLLLHYGTEQQKDYYLPRLASGEDIPCFALTGPDAGSDAASMPDTGVVTKGMFQGEEVTGIRLNWEKRYITLGPVATLLGLAFRLYDPDHHLGEEEDIGITLALIPTDIEGVEIGRRHLPLNQVFMNGPNSGKDVFIPLDWIIGGAPMAGKGWRMLMDSLSDGRGISLPALSTGGGKLASRYTGAYSRVRDQFHMPVGRFEGVAEKLGHIGGMTYSMDAARLFTLTALDMGESPAVASAIVKYNLTEGMRAVLNDAMDIHGGHGISMGPKNVMGRIYQSIPIAITVEGANILTRTLITFGQGAIRAHPWLIKEVQALAIEDEEERSIAFDEALFGHAGFIASNFARTLFLGLTRARLSPAPGRAHNKAKRMYQLLTWMSAAFALVTDAAVLLLGSQLKRREQLSGRLADVLSQIYIASAVLKRFDDNGQPEDELPLLRWANRHALATIQQALLSLYDNLPNKVLATVLRFITFPTGAPFLPPDDRLNVEVAELLQRPSELRDRLTAGIYLSDEATDPMRRAEDALVKVIAAEAIEKRFHQAVREVQPPNIYNAAERLEALVNGGTFTAEEAQQLSDAWAARREVIMVDDFDTDFGLGENKTTGLRSGGKKTKKVSLSIEDHLDLV